MSDGSCRRWENYLNVWIDILNDFWFVEDCVVLDDDYRDGLKWNVENCDLNYKGSIWRIKLIKICPSPQQKIDNIKCLSNNFGVLWPHKPRYHFQDYDQFTANQFPLLHVTSIFHQRFHWGKEEWFNGFSRLT